MNISVFDIIYPSMSNIEQDRFYTIFNELNENVFDGVLEKPDHLGIFNNLDFHGLTIGIRPEKGIKKSGAIILAPLFQDSIEEITYTIAHELIHLFQVQNELLLDHGKLFKDFQAEIAYHYNVPVRNI